MKPLEKLGKSYVDLSQKLAEIEINSLERYTSYRDVTNYFSDYETLKRIEFCYAEKIINNIEEIFKDTSGLSGLCIFTKENQPSITDSHRKKFLLFSNATFINSSHIDIHGVDGLGYEDEPFEYQNGPDLSGCLEYIYNFLPEIRKGMILPVPRSAELFNYEGIYYESLDDVPDDPYTANRRTFTLPPNFYSVPLQSENLSKCEEILKIGLKVPSLDLIPIRTVRKLRKDYTEVFDRFQRFLVRASYKFSTENDDTRLKLILEEVEEEVDILHNSCQEIKKVHKKITFVSGAVPLVLYFAVKNPDLINHLNFLFSGFTGAYYHECFKHQRTMKSKIAENPLYFMQLLNKAMTS